MNNKPQSKSSLTDQLYELVEVANREGLYDAADFLNRHLLRSTVSPEQDLERQILNALERGYTKFKDIQRYCLIEDRDFRVLDRNLQKMRKRGTIQFEKGKWATNPE